MHVSSRLVGLAFLFFFLVAFLTYYRVHCIFVSDCLEIVDQIVLCIKRNPCLKIHIGKDIRRVP